LFPMMMLFRVKNGAMESGNTNRMGLNPLRLSGHDRCASGSAQVKADGLTPLDEGPRKELAPASLR
jgi:hypothetical protein